jgi:hypothetical protein
MKVAMAAWSSLAEFRVVISNPAMVVKRYHGKSWNDSSWNDSSWNDSS